VIGCVVQVDAAGDRNALNSSRSATISPCSEADGASADLEYDLECFVERPMRAVLDPQTDRASNSRRHQLHSPDTT
jgi:hypothetical protein